MWVRAGKQHTTQTNRLGTCNGKPEENLDEIGKTTQSRDWTFSCGSWRGGGKEGTPKPHKYLLQENRAWPVRGVFHGEKRWLYDEKGGCCFISLPLHQRQSTAEAAASEMLHREGGNTNTFHLIQLEQPSEPSKPAWNAPSAMEGHQETSKNVNRLRKDGGETGEQGGPRREMHPAWWAQGMWAQGTGCPLEQWETTVDFMLLRSNIKFKHCRNVNIALKSAKTLTEAKHYPIKLGLYINLSYNQRIVNCSYI